MIPSRQEMFNRAVRGLRGQGWKRALSEYGGCSYLTRDGRRCAWGHVDPDGTRNTEGGVQELAADGIGLAGRISDDDLDFARRLQGAHDVATDATLESEFRQFCSREGLQWPEEQP